MKKLVINDNQLRLLESLLLEEKLTTAIPKLAPGDLLLITNASGGQVKYTVVSNSGTQVFLTTKQNSKEYVVWMAVTSINFDNELEIRTLENSDKNKERFGDVKSWPTTKLKNIAGIEVFDKQKNPKFRIDVDEDPTDDPKTDGMYRPPNQDYIDNDETHPDVPEEEPEMDAELDDATDGEIVKLVLNNPTFKSAFMKHPTFWDLIMKKDSKGILKAKEILNKLYNSDKIPDKGTQHFVDDFRVNDWVKIRLLDDDFQHNHEILDLDMKYPGVVKKRGNGVLIKLQNSELFVKLNTLANAETNTFNGEVRRPIGGGHFKEYPRSIRIYKEL